MSTWGVQADLAVSAVYTAALDVTLTAGSEITCITTGAIAAAEPGNYYPVIWLTATIVTGVAAPTALTFAFRLGAGADVDTFAVLPATLVVSANLMYFAPLVGANSKTAWVGGGSTINITALAATNAATFKSAGSRAVVALFRGLDT